MNSSQELNITTNNNSIALKSINAIEESPPIIQLETDNVQTVEIQLPTLTVTTIISDYKPISSTIAPNSFWEFLNNTFVTGGNNLLNPPGKPRVIKETEFTLLPYYTGLKDGKPSIEEESPITEELNEAIAKSNKQKIIEYFGEPAPFRIDWKFDAFEVISKKSIQIDMTGKTNSDKISIQLKRTNFDQNVVSIKFPQVDKLYLIKAKATITDNYGKRGVSEFVFWNYYSTISKDELFAFINSNTSGNKNFKRIASQYAEDAKYTAEELIYILQAFRTN